MLMKNFCFKRESSGLNLFCSDQSETFLYLFVFPLYLRYARDMRKAYMLYRQILHNGVANVDVKVYSSALNDLSELYESKGCFSFCTDSLVSFDVFFDESKWPPDNIPPQLLSIF